MQVPSTQAVGSAASAIGRGLLAGAAGTAAMTLSSTIEAKLRGRGASSTPADAAEKVVGVEPKGEEEQARLSNTVHWAYGTGWGAARGVFSQAGLSEPKATAAHFGAIWGTALVMLPSLGLTPPPWRWGAKELAIDAMHHGVYTLAAGTAYSALQR